jgi:hypothetical protein
VDTKRIVEVYRESLLWYGETELPNGYIHGRGGRTTGHCEDYTEMIIRNDDLVAFVTPIDRESRTVGDVVAALKRDAESYRSAMTKLNDLIAAIEVADQSMPLVDRYLRKV